MTVPTWRNWLLLQPAARGEDAALLFLRLATGAFLIDGVWDNIASDARMREFVEFMRASHFPAPELLAPFSVWTQFLAGVLLLPGLLVRWGGGDHRGHLRGGAMDGPLAPAAAPMVARAGAGRDRLRSAHPRRRRHLGRSPADK